jgi:hypothetical protein
MSFTTMLSDRRNRDRARTSVRAIACFAFLEVQTLVVASLWLALPLSAWGQSAPTSGKPMFVNPLAQMGQNTLLADATPPAFNPTVLPTDTVPLVRSAENSFLNRETRFNILKRLPSRMFFSLTTETSQRYESNVFFTYGHQKGDYVFRTTPNITLGYDLFPHTSVYCNYFVIKDLFAEHPVLSHPTTQSLALGLRRQFRLGAKTTIQLDGQSRELWQASHLQQADLLPSINLTYAATPSLVLYANTVLQLRGRNYFVAPTREIDPFYTVGVLFQRGRWTFTASTTLVDNFRSPTFHGSIPHHGNTSMISDFEVYRPVFRKFPALVSFIRAEPVFNWDGGKLPGLSGFDFRIFCGLRLAVSKQSLRANVDQLKKQLIDSDQLSAPARTARPQGKQSP